MTATRELTGGEYQEPSLNQRPALAPVVRGVSCKQPDDRGVWRLPGKREINLLAHSITGLFSNSSFARCSLSPQPLSNLLLLALAGQWGLGSFIGTACL